MAKNSFQVSISPFRVLEDFDLNYETPKSTRVQKKLFDSGNNDRHPKKVKLWSSGVLMKKNPLQSNQLELKTPPIINSSMQPFAPTKTRKLLNKTDLKPKKLIFIEESEVFEEIINPRESKLTENNTQSRAQRRRQLTPSDDKENRCAYSRFQFKETNSFRDHSVKAVSTSLAQHKIFKSGLKHLRI